MDVLMYCDKLKLIGKEMFAVDGCKISSNASKEWSGTRADFERKKTKYKGSIDYLIKKHREEDEREQAEKGVREKEEKAVDHFKNKIDKIEKWLDENEDKQGANNNIKKSHVIDNESAKMVSSHGVVQGYNGVAMVDSKHQVIVEAEAYGEGSERNVLKPMLEKTEDNFEEMGEKDIYKKGEGVGGQWFPQRTKHEDAA